MKKIYSLLLLLLACGFASAQNYNVTFQVDMSQQNPIADSVTVAGDFQVAAGYASDWTPGITILTDANTDSVYDITVSLPAGTYSYKFINGVAWGADEAVPGGCAVSGNRQIVVSGNMTVPLVCFGMCTTCPSNVDTVDVTFMVDMRNETIADTVSIAGDLQGAAVGAGWSNWTPGQTVLDDSNMDSIYTITMRLPEGTYAYKYVNGVAWGQDESVPSACAVNNNREVVVSGPGPMTVPLHCYASCDTCIPPLPPINVTFRVDMSNEIVNSGGVYVSGSFQNPAWVKDTLELTDPDMDGIYTYTHSIVPAEYQYKFYNGPNGDPDGETADFLTLGCGVSNGVGGFNRLLDLVGQLTDTILPAYEYNTCNLSPLEIYEIDADRLVVYPNPFTHQTKLDFNSSGMAYDVIITNLNGQQMRVYNNVTSNELIIDRGNLNAGIYFATLITEDGAKHTHKLLIQ